MKLVWIPLILQVLCQVDGQFLGLPNVHGNFHGLPEAIARVMQKTAPLAGLGIEEKAQSVARSRRLQRAFANISAKLGYSKIRNSTEYLRAYDPMQDMKDLANAMKDSDDYKEKRSKLPLMNPIYIFRILVCLLRPDTFTHQECVDFIATQCKGASSGQGYCWFFILKAKKRCSVNQVEEACEVLKDMGEEAEMKPEEPKDSDGDGVPDDKDDFPNNPDEHTDLDGDGYGNSTDLFPKNPLEWFDTDNDGYGDNEDAFPNDAAEYKDSDGDGVGDNEDAFPHNPRETIDSDGDGVGDNEDAFPNDPKCQTLTQKGCSDRDGDSYPDEIDAFPDDDNEWKDSDGDGVGDNADEFPYDPKCTKRGEGCSGDKDGDGVADENDAFPNDSRCHEKDDPVCPKPIESGLDKKGGRLPEQGYNEFGADKVKHVDMETHTGDWMKEDPSKKNEAEETRRICEKNPHLRWCRRFLDHVS